MEGYLQMGKLKRKELDEVSDEFSDFSLSSPARKIRRLDAELPPIIEEPDIPIEYELLEPEQSFGSNARSGVVIEELLNEPENEERALVLFKPLITPFVQSPSNFSVSVKPELISGFKNQVLWSNESNSWKAFHNEAKEQDKKSTAAKECLAVVPWVPSQLPSATGSEAVIQMDHSDMMEAEEMGGATMDIEDGNIVDQRTGMLMNEGLHQWQQQHCMIPQPPKNSATPVVWFQ